MFARYEDQSEIIFNISLLRLGDCQHDSGQRCVSFVSRCGQLHADGQPGIKEIGVFVSNELRQVTAGYGHYGCEYICKGLC